MLSDLGVLLSWVKDVFDIPITLYGYTFSMWQVFLFDIVVGIVAFILREVFLGD